MFESGSGTPTRRAFSWLGENLSDADSSVVPDMSDRNGDMGSDLSVEIDGDAPSNVKEELSKIVQVCVSMGERLSSPPLKGQIL